AEALEQANLNLLGAESDETVESRRETLEIFPRQADNQVSVDVDTRFPTEPAEVFLDPRVVLATADEFRDVFVEGLDADLELQRPRAEFPDGFTERIGQAVGNHLEVDEQIRPIAFEEEIQDRRADFEIQVEGAIDELELSHATVEQALHRDEKCVERRI